MLWRRSFDTPPPPLADDDEFSQAGDPRYADLGDETAPHRVPQGRHRPVPALLGRPRSSPTCEAGHTVLVAAHGNSLRALVKHLDQISDDDIAGLNIPTGMPLVYELDESTARPPSRGGAYLDPEAPRPRPRPSPTRVADRASTAAAGAARR